MSIANRAIGLMVAAIVIGAVSIPVVQETFALETNSVANDTISSSGSVPETITANTVEDGLVEDSETITLTDSYDSSTVTLTKGDDYEVLDYETGEFNVTNADPDDDGTDEINATSDEYSLDYDYKPDGYVDNATSRLILGFVVVGLAVSLFVASFSMVR